MDLRKFSIRTYVHKKRAYIINFEDKAPTIKNLYRIKQNKKKNISHLFKLLRTNKFENLATVEKSSKISSS